MKNLFVGFLAVLTIFGFYNTAISAENLGGKITLAPTTFSQSLTVNNFDDLFQQTRVYLIKSDTANYWRLEWSRDYDIISFSAFPRYVVVTKSYSFFDNAGDEPWLQGSEIRLDNLEIEAEILDLKNDPYKEVSNIRTYMKAQVSVQLETFNLKEVHYDLLIDALKNKRPIAIEGKIGLKQDQGSPALFDHVLKNYQNLRLIIFPTQIGNLKLTN